MYVKHKEGLGTFASFLERFEAFSKSLNAFRALWERMGAFGRLSRLVSIIPYGMACMYVCNIITTSKAFARLRTAALSPIYNLVLLVAMRI